MAVLVAAQPAGEICSGDRYLGCPTSPATSTTHRAPLIRSVVPGLQYAKTQRISPGWQLRHNRQHCRMRDATVADNTMRARSLTVERLPARRLDQLPRVAVGLVRRARVAEGHALQLLLHGDDLLGGAAGA